MGMNNADRLDYVQLKDIDAAVFKQVLGERIAFFAACARGAMCPIGKDVIDYQRAHLTLKLKLARALLNHLKVHRAKEAGSPEAVRLLRVLPDQLATAACEGSYLPRPTNPMRSAVLQALEQRPTTRGHWPIWPRHST